MSRNILLSSISNIVLVVYILRCIPIYIQKRNNPVRLRSSVLTTTHLRLCQTFIDYWTYFQISGVVIYKYITLYICFGMQTLSYNLVINHTKFGSFNSENVIQQIMISELNIVFDRYMVPTLADPGQGAPAPAPNGCGRMIFYTPNAKFPQ